MLQTLNQPLSRLLAETGEVYRGQFGEFTIDRQDRQEVLIYRAGLLVAAASFALATLLTIAWFQAWPAMGWATGPWFPVSLLYGLFCLGLGVSLWTIHIYLKPLHRALQIFWAVGCVASLVLALRQPDPFAVTLYQQRLSIWGIGFTFAALTGIFFKEAFCFNRFETKILTLLVPMLLLGHLFAWLTVPVETLLLSLWAGLFLVFALRKTWQAIPDDIGDKSVFAYLKQQALQKSGLNAS
jgi:uncharacterized integral membrane protein